ncbi:hypothetical protein GCM10028827_07210 [Mucilaginibacter myungsuensis]
MAQNAYVSLGRQALFDGEFRKAVAHLERACVIDTTNADTYWMLGYSYYHNRAYKKCVTAYTKAISLKPVDGSAYLWRARAKSHMAKDPQISQSDKEKSLLGSIIDYTKALDIDGNDMLIYQNRAIAYREYGEFKLLSSKQADKARGVNSLKASITDLERVLNSDASRGDIENLIAISKEKLASATGRR